VIYQNKNESKQLWNIQRRQAIVEHPYGVIKEMGLLLNYDQENH
jgi:hypothetical protein